MSNALSNAHIEYGQPCGDEADFDQIAEWAGNILLDLKEPKLRINQNSYHMEILRPFVELTISAVLASTAKYVSQDWYDSGTPGNKIITDLIVADIFETCHTIEEIFTKVGSYNVFPIIHQNSYLKPQQTF